MQNSFDEKSQHIINIDDISSNLPDLKNKSISKVNIISRWLCDTIQSGLQTKTILVGDRLPSKSEFAYLLGVSLGTIQNALRQVEDMGYVHSKQKIGTLVKSPVHKSEIKKLTSKRDIVIENLKKYIKTNHKIGDKLPSSRKIAAIIGSSQNTTRLALENLGLSDIVYHKNNDNIQWFVKQTDFNFVENSCSETLVLKTVSDLKNYISKNLANGDKMPPHAELVSKFNVSLKTVHDALKILIDDGILLARRGRYGTTVLRLPNEMAVEQRFEKSIFAPATQTALYFYEKTQNSIKKLIAENYQIGMKLPSICELSKQMDLSPNTIRKAFHNLAKEGYLAFSRGRYGGTFVIDIPEVQSFKWLAVNPEYSNIKIN